MKQYTDIIVLLDRSGSMGAIKGPMETAFNKFIEEHQSVPSTKITLIQFDDQNIQDVVYQNVPIKAAEKLTLTPRGWTPLIDAFVTAIDNTGKRLSAMSESDRPDQVLFVVITDGAENSSTQYKRKDVSDRVTRQRDTYKWNFVYLGANQDAIAEAASYGIDRNFAFAWDSVPQSVASSGTSLSANTVSYVANVQRGSTKSLAWTDAQRADAVEDAGKKLNKSGKV